MADQINVTDTRSRSPWPWIFGIIVLAVLVWAIAQMGGTDGNEAQIEVPAATTPAGDTGGDAGAGNANPPPQQ